MKPHLVLNDEEKQQRLDDDVAVGNGVDGNVDDGDTGVQVQECAQMGENLIKKALSYIISIIWLYMSSLSLHRISF